jgi:hemoglobin
MADNSLYGKFGGEEFFTKLVDAFYAEVPSEPLLAAMYPADDMVGANERLRLFLMQYWGGPTTYNETRGHPRLRMRHMPFAVDSAAKDAWMRIMSKAVKAQNLPSDLESELMQYFESTARFMINTGDDEQIKWRNTNAK